MVMPQLPRSLRLEGAALMTQATFHRSLLWLSMLCLLLGLLCLSAVAAEAQQSKPAERWLITAHAADLGSTIYALQQPGLSEGNPLLGAHPSNTRLVLTKAAFTTAQVWGLRQLAKKDPVAAKWLTVVCAAVPSVIAVNNLRLAVRAR